MQKLTKKQFANTLVGTSFLRAIHHLNLDQVLESIDEAKELPIIYDVENVILRSKDFVMVRTDGSKSYRDFYGKNTYLKKDDLLIHVNVQDEHTTIFLNL